MNSLDLSRSAGSASATLRPVDDELREIMAWFNERDIMVGFTEDGQGGIRAMIVPDDVRVAIVPFGWGETKLEAARDAKARWEAGERPGQDVVIRGMPATAKAEAQPGEVKKTILRGEIKPTSELKLVRKSVEMPVESLQDVARKVEIPVEVQESAERIATKFGWHISFVPEPDCRYSWYVFGEDGLPLQSGVADDWDEAKLSCIIDLSPPSGEK